MALDGAIDDKPLQATGMAGPLRATKKKRIV